MREQEHINGTRPEYPMEDDGHHARTNGGARKPPPSDSRATTENEDGYGRATYNVKAISGLLEEAVKHAAERLYDPDEIRALAYEAGRRLHAVEGERLFYGGALDRLYDGLGGIREGAVLQPAQHEGIRLLKTIRSTRAVMESERARGAADQQRAQRLIATKRCELVEAVNTAAQEVVTLETELEKVERDLDAALQVAGAAEKQDEATEAPRGRTFSWKDPRTWRRGGGAERSIFARVSISPKAVMIAVPLEIVATTALIEGPISELVATSSSIGSYLIAAAVSTAFLALGLVTGFAAAAMRLPGRVMGAVIVGLSMWLLVDAASALDLIRLSDERGIHVLTIATLATVLVAAVTAYASTTYKAANTMKPVFEEKAVYEDIGVRLPLDHPAMAILRLRDRTIVKLDGARASLADRRLKLDALDGEIERLVSSLEETDVRVLAAEKEGLEAQVAFIGLESITETQIAQEKDNVGAAKAAAELGHRLVRAEEIPDPDDENAETKPSGAPSAWADKTRRLSRLQKAAFGALVLGVLAGLVLGTPFPAGVGAVAAAVVWAMRGRERGDASRAATGREPVDRRPSITPTTDESNPKWREQPSTTVPKYERGSTDPTQRA